MQYDVYHDESKEVGYWHGILIVPRHTRFKVLEHLSAIRLETGFNLPLSLKGVKGRMNRFQCSRAAVQLAVYAMMQNNKGKVEKVLVSDHTYDQLDKRRATNYREIIHIAEPLGLRFIVFRERDCLKFLDPAGEFLDYGAKVETTFRMGFKGGLHLLFDEDHQAVICSVHFDGYEHNKRHVDKRRIIDRLKQGLRPYCRITDSIIVDDRTSAHQKADAQSYDDCQFLQITDLLIGSFRTVLAEKKNDFQAEVAAPVASLVEKWKRGHARMKNSRWYRAFCLSQCYLDNGRWQFNPLPAKGNPNQLCLPFP